MPNPRFIITDGTTTIDLLSRNPGYHINEWTPSIPDIKDGGVFQSSPFVHGRRLTHRVFSNAIETLDLKLNAKGQDVAIQFLQDLRRLLEKAVTYWTTDWQGEPVWIEARGSMETNTRYAVIMDYRALADDNPYAQPFFNCNAVVDDFTLVLERGHWTDKPPGDSTCVQVSSTNTFDRGVGNLLVNGDFEIAGGGAPDIFSGWTEVWPGGTSAIAQITDDVTQPPPSGNNACKITGDLPTKVPSLYQNVVVIPLTTYRFIVWSAGDGEAGATYHQGSYTIYDNTNAANIVALTVLGLASTMEFVATIVDITTPAGCVSVRITLGGSSTASFCWFDNVSFYKYPNIKTFGRTATCNNNEVFLANKWEFAQLTHIFIYDVDGSDGWTWSPNQLDEPLPISVFPTNPAVNDAVYFGVDASISNFGPFTSLVFDLLAPTTAVTTVVWQYWNGVTHAWTALDVQDNTKASTVAFTVLGVNSVHWKIPANWWSTTINGVNAHWIRAIVTGIGALPQTAVQWNRYPYAVILPYAEIDSAQIYGDISALANIKLKQVSDHSGAPAPVLSAYEAYLSLRSLGRGQYFYQFLNLGDTQNIPGMTCVAGLATTMQPQKAAPSGRCAVFNPTGVDAMEVRAYLGIDETITEQFLGEFHIFMRAFQVGGTDQDFTCRLVINIGSTPIYTSDDMDMFITSDANLPQSIDFGVVDIGKLAKRFALGVGVSYMTFSVYVDNASVGADGDLYLYDLVLVPTDEFCVHLITYTDPLVNDATYGKEVLVLDSVTVPSEEIVSYIAQDVSGYMISDWERISVGPFILQANSSQRIFTYLISTNANANYKESCPCIVLSVKSLEKLQRYLSMRGTR